MARTEPVRRPAYEIELSEFARSFIESELTPWQKSVMEELIAGLEHGPARKGRAVREEKSTRIVNKGGFRARYKFDPETRRLNVEAVTAPLASVAGDRYSVWELPKFKAILEQQVGTPLPELTRDEHWAIVREGIGSRPDLPPGKEYVRRLWGGRIRNR